MVNRDQVIAYLLHEMPEDEREAFAERWFVEPELSEELRTVEADLLDAYARGTALGEQRKQIERWLLGSATQRRKLDFAQALAAAIPAAVHQTTPRRGIPWAALGAVAAGLALLASLATSIVRNRNLENELARTEARGRSQVQARPLTGGVYAILLPADTLRSNAGISISLPKGADVLHLELGLDASQARDFDSAVVSISGRVVWRQQPVSVEGASPAIRASLWIPASLLGSGNYTVRLESGGAPTAYYSFTVMRD
jgi:hypothetical protein